MNKYIKNRVAQYFKFNTHQLNKFNRKRELVYARHMAMKLIRDNTRLSYEKIGEEFYRDHATAMHGCRTIVDLMRFDKTVRRDYEFLTREIEKRKENDALFLPCEVERFKKENSLDINQRVNFNNFVTLFRMNLNS